jgi:hypothetical protein
MTHSSRPRKTTNLSELIHQQLNMYALAASAAGVGVLTLAQSAEGRIVYTPSHQIIGHGTRYGLDLNHDGQADFVFLNTSFCNTDFCKSHVSIHAKADNTVDGAVIIDSYRAAFALGRGMRVDAGRHLEGQAALVDVILFGYRYCQWGYWCNVKNRYLGLAFKIKGKVHYGWARLNVTIGTHHVRATLTGYAYETIVGKSIKAGQTKETADDPGNAEFGPGSSLTNPPDTPQPASLGMLALGARGVPLWRRREYEPVVQDS